MSNRLINIEFIRECVKQRNVIWTKHCLNRINQRNILISDVKNAIENGKIIECYYEDYPFPSFLILGRDKRYNVIHVVCGVSSNMIYIITSYYPNSDKWEEDMKSRREK